MALETLKGIDQIGGFRVVVMDDLKEKYPERFNPSGAMDWNWFEKDIRPNAFIYVRQDKNSLSFTLQNGPIKENGVNGCQVDTIIESAMIIIRKLNDNYPCEENNQAIYSLGCALDSLAKRTADRVKREVEGQSKT